MTSMTLFLVYIKKFSKTDKRIMFILILCVYCNIKKSKGHVIFNTNQAQCM